MRKQSAPATYNQSPDLNPFLPPDPVLTVGCLTPHHVAVLNKFNVLAHHVLVVTRDFRHQESPLTVDDFAAVSAALAGGPSLAFYNAGRIAGASQAHKHFQLVPLPLGPDPGPNRDGAADIPMAVLFEDAASGINTVRPLRFQHAICRLDADPSDAPAFGRACHQAYAHALRELGVAATFDAADARRLPPYNLLVTERWLFVAPRRAEHYRDISVNGLGYAGSLFVSSPEKLERVRSVGPMAILDAVSSNASNA